MGDFRERLDAEARRVTADPDRFGDVVERSRRRRIRRQVTSSVVALAIAGGSFALAYGAFRGPGPARPIAGPSPSATSSVEVRLLDGADDPEAMEIARDLIGSAGFEVVETGPAGHTYETTTISCPLEFDHEAARIADRLGVEAAIVPAIPNTEYDLTVCVGEDFATFESGLLAWIRDFVEARQNGDAERFLGPS
jgi:LytR cell envelope-related transcriptional attenuator